MKPVALAFALSLVAACASVQDRTQPQPAAAGASSPAVFVPLRGPSPCWETSLCSRP